MENQKVTIHRALAELKLIDSRIMGSINAIIPTAIYQKGKLIGNHMTEEVFKSNATSEWDSITDLIERKKKIKSTIVNSNATTKVKIAGKEMTVSDAISFKQVIGLKKELFNRLENVQRATLAQLNTNNTQVQQNLQRILEVTFGKESTKISKDDADNVRVPFLAANEFHLYDPLGVQGKMDALKKEIDEFETDVDAALSESNAITFIEI